MTMTTTPIAAGTWTIDVAGTRAGFAVRNFGLKTVHGTIAVTAGTLEVRPTGAPIRLSSTLDPSSIDTGNPRRDTDLRSTRFLNVAAHPSMDVVADQFEQTETGWRARAVLRVAGAETPLWIEGTLDEASADRLALTGAARLDRRAAGIRAPRFLIGRWVEIMISARLTRTADPRLP
jgi:polyisoprenoid-binding protein YceI